MLSLCVVRLGLLSKELEDRELEKEILMKAHEARVKKLQQSIDAGKDTSKLACSNRFWSQGNACSCISPNTRSS